MKARQLWPRLWHVIVPTWLQVLGCIVLAALVLTVVNGSALLGRFNSDPTFVAVLSSDFHRYLGKIVGYNITGQLVVIGFWSTIGLVVYLITWWARNLAISSRNEVILHTAYDNVGSSQPELIHLVIKLVAGAIGVISLAIMPYAFHGWQSLWQPLLHDPITAGVIERVALSVLGLGVELYLTLILIQLAFTPWYADNAFTA